MIHVHNTDAGPFHPKAVHKSESCPTCGLFFIVYVRDDVTPAYCIACGRPLDGPGYDPRQAEVGAD